MQVTKVIEGGYDFAMEREVKTGVIISNGRRELMVPVDMDTLKTLIAMHVEVNGEPKGALREPPKGTTMDAASPPAHRPRLVESDSQTATFQVPSEPEPVIDDEEWMPGEEYEDTGTGASSL